MLLAHITDRNEAGKVEAAYARPQSSSAQGWDSRMLYEATSPWLAVHRCWAFWADASSLPPSEVGAGTALLPHNLDTGTYPTVKAGLGPISATCPSMLG